MNGLYIDKQRRASVGRLLTLDIDAPGLGVKAEGLEGAMLAEKLGLIDELISAIVTGTWITFRVLVWLMERLAVAVWVDV